MGTCSVLIIEDDESTRQLLAAAFRGCGYLTREAGTIQAGRRELQACGADLIVLDRGLPDGDGLGLCTLLRKEFKFRRIPILMLTGKSEVDKWAVLIFVVLFAGIIVLKCVTEIPQQSPPLSSIRTIAATGVPLPANATNFLPIPIHSLSAKLDSEAPSRTPVPLKNTVSAKEVNFRKQVEAAQRESVKEKEKLINTMLRGMGSRSGSKKRSEGVW